MSQPNPKEKKDHSRLHAYTQKEGFDLWVSWRKHPHIPTGFKSLDAILDGGLGIKQLTTVIGYTGTGKSEFVRQIRSRVLDAGYNVIHIDAELGIHRLFERDLVQKTKMIPKKVRSGKFSPLQEKTFLEACEYLTTRNNLITLNPGGGVDVEKLLIKVKKILDGFKGTHPALIILDSVQRFSQGMEGGDDRTKLKRTMYRLESFIHKQNASLLTVSEGRRPAKNSKDEEKTLEVFKSKASESNAVEFTSDTVIVLDRQDSTKHVVKPLGSIEQTRIVEIIIAKNRSGEDGWLAEKARFTAPYWSMEIK